MLDTFIDVVTKFRQIDELKNHKLYNNPYILIGKYAYDIIKEELEEFPHKRDKDIVCYSIKGFQGYTLKIIYSSNYAENGFYIDHIGFDATDYTLTMWPYLPYLKMINEKSNTEIV